NTSELLRIDYGAGDPDCSRNEHPVSSGRKIKSTVGNISKTASKPYFWTLFLFKLVREFKPRHCVELGTCFGISSSYLAAALKLNQGGTLVTLEGAESCAELATQNFETLGLDNIDVVIGRFVDTLEGVLKRRGTIDFAFVDGHHEQTATIAYFEQIRQHLARHAVLVFDDISWSDGMRNAWNFISRHKQTKFALDLGVVGVCLYDSDVQQVPAMRIPLV
ncbi:MAG: O-methyltransferase, partial [bacterium]